MRAFIVIFCLLIFTACGTTNIYVNGAEHNQYRVFVNGKEKGTNHVKITKRGLPQKSYIEVKTNDDKVLLSETIKRKFVFNVWTVVSLIYPYSLIANFEYEKEYRYNVPSNSEIKSPWDLEYKSAWD